MSGSTFGDLKIRWIIVSGVAIFVMDLFAWLESSACCFLSNKSVLVGIATNVSKMVLLANTYENIPIGRNDSPAFPLMIFLATLIFLLHF